MPARAHMLDLEQENVRLDADAEQIHSATLSTKLNEKTAEVERMRDALREIADCNDLLLARVIAEHTLNSPPTWRHSSSIDERRKAKRARGR